MIHDHSTQAYIRILSSLSKRQQQVLDVFGDGLGHTDREVSRILDLEINQVTGRIRELLDKGKIVEIDKIHIGGRSQRICQIVKQKLFNGKEI